MTADVIHFNSTRGLPKRMANSHLSKTTIEEPDMLWVQATDLSFSSTIASKGHRTDGKRNICKQGRPNDSLITKEI